METETSLKKNWTITPEAFEKLLVWLDAEDREAAGLKYEKIRLKLLKLFKWRNCQPEEYYADETIDRVTRRVAEGAPVEVRDPYLYFHGIALNVIREFWRGQQLRPPAALRALFHLFLACRAEGGSHPPTGVPTGESRSVCAGAGAQLSRSEGFL
jgi:hypothetical protein